MSHDRYFLNRVCTAILAFGGEGEVRYAVGNYDYYLEKRTSSADTSVAQAPSPNESKPTPAKPRKLKWKEERELEGMEASILAAESEVTRFEQLFASPDFYQKHAADWSKLEADFQAARDRVAQLYARWEALVALAGENNLAAQ